MPNHFFNKIIAPTEVLKYIVNEQGLVDFNNIIKMPDALVNTVRGSDVHWGLQLLKGNQDAKEKLKEHSDERKNEMIEVANRYLDNKEKYGHGDWYEWSNFNWDVKWNAYGQDKKYVEGDDSISFNTAWSAPYNIIINLANKFKGISFKYITSDEFDDKYTTYEFPKDLEKIINERSKAKKLLELFLSQINIE